MIAVQLNRNYLLFHSNGHVKQIFLRWNNITTIVNFNIFHAVNVGIMVFKTFDLVYCRTLC